MDVAKVAGAIALAGLIALIVLRRLFASVNISTR
jgi:hypothetical protein